jgi:hypothetical protein
VTQDLAEQNRRGEGNDGHPGSTGRSFSSRAISAALVGTTMLVLLSLAFITVVHVDDRFGVDQASGARVALARYFDRGVLYPELYDGRHYGGTRFMPLPLIAHGSVAKFTGEYLTSGKLVAYVFALLLGAVLIWLLRRTGSSWPIAIALATVVFTTRVGLDAVIDVRGDVPSTVLQLLAVGVVANSRRPSATVWGALLSALAFLAKTSAIWAPIAIGLWLLAHDRRNLLRFVLFYGASVATLLAIFGLLSGGRLFENVFGLGGSGISSPRRLLTSPYKSFRLLISHAAPVLPLAVLMAWIFWRRVVAGRISLYMMSLAAALIVAWLVLSDIGTGWNQLLDPLVLGALVVGEEVGERDAGRSRSILPGLVALGAISANLLGAALTYRPPVQGTVTGAATLSRSPLEGVAEPGTRLLSEDPYLPVSLGQTPVVLDAFMLLRIGRDDPRALDDLAERVRDREFDLVALVEPLEPVNREWWTEVDFGATVMQAMADSYGFDRKLQGYYLYRPKEDVE